MGSSWSRRDRIIRLAKLRGDKTALAIMDWQPSDTPYCYRLVTHLVGCSSLRHVFGRCDCTESELRAMWGDR